MWEELHPHDLHYSPLMEQKDCSERQCRSPACWAKQKAIPPRAQLLCSLAILVMTIYMKGPCSARLKLRPFRQDVNSPDNLSGSSAAFRIH